MQHWQPAIAGALDDAADCDRLAEVTVFREGMSAFLRGKTMASCPYAIGTVPFEVWQEGWLLRSAVESGR